MDKKEISEIRKTLKKGTSCITSIRGYYIDNDKSVIAEIEDSVNTMPEEDFDKYCLLFAKAISGKLGKNLFNMEFPLNEEEAGGKQDLLRNLVKSDMNKIQLDEFAQRIIENYNSDDRYAILFAKCVYDVVGKTKDGLALDDASEIVYDYIAVAICPVVPTKSAMYYDDNRSVFLSKSPGWELKMPENGFLYPAFNDRQPDIHAGLYYAKSENKMHDELADAVFGTRIPASETLQKNIFTSLIEETLGRDCSYEKVASIIDELELIKDENPEETVAIGKEQIRRLLKEGGAEHDAIERLDEVYEEMGIEEDLSADNLCTGNVTIESPVMKISIKNEAAPLVRTTLVDGQESIVIPISSDMTYNGIRLLAAGTENT